MTNRAKLSRLPIVISQLRRRAGFKSQNAAALAIQKKTGAFLHKAQISHWERGKAMPTLASLLTFLEGLGYSLQDFQDELDRAAGVPVDRPPVPVRPAPAPRSKAAAPKPAAPKPRRETDLAARVEELERRLRSLTGDGSTGDSDS